MRFSQAHHKLLLEIPKSGALNMHGSLLPKDRGRVPVNWAIIHGETETGATLHYMTEKPDNGDIVAQQTVPILPGNTALQVFQKVTVAAEIALNTCLPDLLAGRAEAMAMLKSRMYEDELRKRNAEKHVLEDGKSDIGWGHQIRSYVLDQSRIKDLRTNYEVGNTQGVLDGDLDDFISASLKQGV